MNTEGEIQLNNVLQREVAELHQAIGELTARIDSLERQKECLIRVAGEDKKETAYLLRNPANAKRLIASIEAAEQGNVVQEKEIDLRFRPVGD